MMRQRRHPPTHAAPPARSLLSDIGEDRLVDLLTHRLPQSERVVVGPGDDCAVLRSADPRRELLLKTDCIVEGVHFAPDTRPGLVGRKALARALSDVAAMAGRPLAALVTLVVPPSRTVRHVAAIYDGLAHLAREAGVDVVGGETSSSNAGGGTMLSVSLLGDVPAGRAVLRSGARPGDAILVTGRLGGAWRTRRHLTFPPRLREAAWLADRFRPTAMMDLSDGLARDLPRLAAASQVGFRIDPSTVPRARGCSFVQAVNDGEDYELLFTIPPGSAARLAHAWHRRFPAVPLSEVGEVTAPGTRQGIPDHGGWDHFAR